MMVMLFPLPILLGTLLLSVGWWRGDRWLRIAGDGILAVGLLLLVYQVYTVREGWYDWGAPYVDQGLFLEDLTDYAAFTGFSLAAGLLAGDGVVQLFRKKSSSS